MRPTEIPSELVESTKRRTFLKAAVGTAATVAAIPAVSTIAAAHFPKTLAIDIVPESSENRITVGENARVSVAVLYTEFEDENGNRVVFDPTERAVRYRFGTHERLENGGGARPVGDGEVRDVNSDGHDDLVLTFPVAGTGFSGDETQATLFWERDASGEHGLAGTDTIIVPDDIDLSDIDILNYALRLEHLEAAFYHDFLDTHSESEVESSEIANYFARPTLQYSTYQQIEELHEHEHAHVEALTEAIEKLGGNPVEAADYEFTYDSIEEFVALADRLEAVGVSAYAGVAPMIENTEVLKTALSIHSVEANHQTYFQLLHLQRPAPDAFNPARSMDQVLPIAKQYISSE
jgi:rubrerythrin